MGKAFDYGPKSPRFKSHLLLHKGKSLLRPKGLGDKNQTFKKQTIPGRVDRGLLISR